MQSLAAANEEVARILLHLGRSCIQHKSLESSEDEEEEEEEEEEKEDCPEELKKEKEKNETQKVNQKKKNLLEKLYLSYNQRLGDFVNSSQWPDYQLSPSSLLDGLFDTSFEDHPNVLIITLYSVDIGYSIKMTVDDNNPPIETYFNYEEDSILEYVKNEELPPHLLDLLEKAKPSLFYCGCVIAEIHDEKTDKQMISRVLLRPSNMSVLTDVNQLLAYSSTLNWSYEEKIKLESLLMLASHPELCIESSPSAGQAVRLLYDMFALQRTELNPLKNSKQITYNIFDTGSIRGIYHKSSNSFLNEVQQNSNLAKSANCSSNVNMNCHLMWEFDFRLESVTLIKLSILVVVKTQEYSVLLKMISQVNSVLRFKINLKTNNLKAYISIILEILKEKIDSRVSLVRTYKSGSKPSYVKFLPMLFNDNIHEPSKLVISQLLDNLLKSKLEMKYNNSKITQKKSLNLVSPINLSQNVFKKKKSYNSILRKRAKIICKNNNVQSEDLKTDSEKCYMKRRKCSIAKMLLHSKKNNETSTSNNANILENGAESNHTLCSKDLEPPPLSPSAVGLLASSPMTCVTSVPSSLVTDTSSTVIQIEHEPTTLKQEVQNDKRLASLELRSIALAAPFVSSSSSEISFVSNTDLELSSVSSPINVVSSVPSPITVVSSTLSKVSSTEAISINSLLASQNLTLQTDRKLLSAFRGQRVRINTKLKSVHPTKNQHLKLLLSNCDAAKTSHIIKQNPPQSINDVIKTASGTLLTQYVMKPGGKSAVHKNGIGNAGQTIYKKIICGNAVGNVNKTLPQLAATLQRTSSVDQTATNCQLDRRKTKIINNLLNSKDLMTSQPTIPMSLPGVIVPKNTTSLNQFNNHQVNIAPRSSTSSVSSFTCQTLNNIKPAIMGSISTANNTQ